MATATERLWRTADGVLVRDGDVAAAQLAYAAGDEIAPRDESLVPGADQAEAKAAEKPDNKMAPPPANKAAAKPGNK